MTRRILLVLVALSLAAGGLFAGAKGEAKTAGVEISWQVWVTPNLTREFYDGVVKAFQEKNPGIRVKIIEANANITPAADDFIKTRLAAGDVPDLMSNITAQLFAEHLWQLPANDPDLAKLADPKITMYEGKLYNFAPSIQPQGLIFYNKKLWAQAGLTATPKTWAEFDAACRALKAKGITPIITGGNWVAGYVFAIVTSAEVFHRNPNWYADRYAGKVRFTDADWVEAATVFKNMVDQGYFNKGALSLEYANLEQEFLAGKAAMYPMGSWFTAAEAKAQKDFEVGVFFAPTKDGKPHLLQSLMFGSWGIWAKSKNPDAAYKLAKFFYMDPTYGAKFLEVDGLFSALKPPLTYPMSQLQKDLMALLPTAQTTSGLYNLKAGAMPPAGIIAVYDKVGQGILAGTVTDVKTALAELDDFWNKAK